MSLRAVTLFHLGVPLKKPIRHASHERSSSDNLVVRATLESGQVGFGEGIPRPYVTGETIESTFEVLSRLDVASQIGRPSDWSEAVDRIAALKLPEIEDDPRGMAANAARCALELALLDAYARQFGRSIGEALAHFEGIRGHLNESPEAVRYSGAITADSARKERISAWKMRIYGFHQVKIKVGVDGQDDPARLRTLRRILGRRMDIRLDANEAWSPAELLEKTRPLLPFQATALEQPTRHEDVGALAELRPKIGIPIMLDESLCGFPDAERAIQDGTADILNVRLSKCGGLFPSLRIIALAYKHGLGVQLGCHPGETAILSAAGRHLASRVRGLRYVEGSYDRHVLTDNLISDDITFRYGGRARPIEGPGLGIEIDPDALARLTVRSQDITHG